MPQHSILIACIQERQSYNSGLDLARRLAALGHNVCFIGNNSLETREHVTRNGFDFIGIGDAEEDFQRAFRDANCFRRAILLCASIKNNARAMEKFAKGNQGRFQLLLLDVVNSDSVVSYAGLLLGSPAITFCSGYAARFDARYPPAVWCAKIPSVLGCRTLLQKLGNVFSWVKSLFSKLVLRHFRGRDPLIWLVFGFAAALSWNYRRKARRLGAHFCLGDWGIRLDAPEIALAVRSIDWPMLQCLPTRFYMNREAFHRMEHRDVDWRSGLDLEKPLIYCSLGANIGKAVWKNYSEKV